MYALPILFPLGLDMRSTVEKMGDQFSSVHMAAWGFISETFLMDETAGE
jgi:hypothetical protein